MHAEAMGKSLDVAPKQLSERQKPKRSRAEAAGPNPLKAQKFLWGLHPSPIRLLSFLEQRSIKVFRALLMLSAQFRARSLEVARNRRD
jgi:hypothetical protein